MVNFEHVVSIGIRKAEQPVVPPLLLYLIIVTEDVVSEVYNAKNLRDIYDMLYDLSLIDLTPDEFIYTFYRNV